jgi:predicted PurR-regulated permease PerM
LQVVGFIPTIILALLKAHDTGENFWLIMLATLVVFTIVQIIQDGYLVPRIMGKMTGLNAAVILLSLSIWGTLFGFIGLIIALPLTTIIVSYYKRFILHINNSPRQNDSLT